MEKYDYQPDDDESELRELFAILFRKKAFIAKWTTIVTVIVLLGSLGVQLFKPPIKHHSAQVEVTLAHRKGFPRHLDLLASLPESKVVAEAVKKELDLTQDIKEIITNTHTSISQEKNSVIISFENEDGDQATRIADALIGEVTDIAKESMAYVSLEVTSPVSLSKEQVVVRREVNIILNTILGFVIGLIANVFLALTSHFISDKISTVGDVTEKLGVQVLGSIPKYQMIDNIEKE